MSLIDDIKNLDPENFKDKVEVQQEETRHLVIQLGDGREIAAKDFMSGDHVRR